MARVSRAQCDLHREAITQASARLIRERGIKGASVADAMAAAGLTHGGFYGHFESKDALVATACGAAFKQARGRWAKRLAGRRGRAAALAAVAVPYLSARSRDDPGDSCPLPALAGDIARENADAPVRAAFAEGLAQLVSLLAEAQLGADAPAALATSPAQARSEALADVALLAGALLLARATAGQPLSDDMLAAAKARLLAQP